MTNEQRSKSINYYIFVITTFLFMVTILKIQNSWRRIGIASNKEMKKKKEREKWKLEEIEKEKLRKKEGNKEKKKIDRYLGR